MSYNNPTYLLGDLNENHRFLGNRSNNNVGKGLKRMLDENEILHDGPNFSTFISENKKGSPNLIFSNNKIYHNKIITQGPVTSSDHLPVILTLTTKAIRIPTKPRYSYIKTNWDNFKEETQRKINITDTQIRLTSKNQILK